MGLHASFRNSNTIQCIPRMICEKKWLERRGVRDRSARREGNPQHWFVCARVQDRCGISTSLGCRWLLSHMKKFQTVLEVSETNKPTSLHNEKTKREGIPAIAAGWLYFQLTSFQTVSVIPQTNKQQSMHKADTLSIHVHSPSLRYHRPLYLPTVEAAECRSYVAAVREPWHGQ